MSLLLLGGLLILNVVISAWNAYAAGRMWNDASTVMSRVLCWSGLVMASAGFSYVLLALVAWGAYLTRQLSPETLNALLSLGYIAIVIPVLGSGAIITLHSWHVAWKSRRLGDMALGGYNTYAQARNMIDAVRNVPGAWEIVSTFFGSNKKSKSKDAEKAIVLLLAFIALCAGALTTYAIFAAGRRHSLLHLDRERRVARAKTSQPLRDLA